MKYLRISVIVFAAAICLASARTQNSGGDRTRAEMLKRASRWPVKVGGDDDASAAAEANPRTTTIAKLNSNKRPTSLPMDMSAFNHADKATYHSKRLATEKKQVTVDAIITLIKYEAGDHDFHFVLRDPNDPNATMIAEIPDPALVPTDSPFRDGIKAMRQFARDELGARTSGRVQPNRRAKVTGVLYWDYAHGQTGLADNAIEIHPILGIELED